LKVLDSQALSLNINGQKNMKLYYVPLNNTDEVLQIVRVLLEQKLAVCVNWFAITSAYPGNGKIIQEPQIILLIKTLSGYRERIEEVIFQHISSTNFIAELTPSKVNQEFLDWLNKEIPNNSLLQAIN